MELVIEFFPQRLFYIGLVISSTTLLGCIVYLIYDTTNRRRKKKEKKKIEADFDGVDNDRVVRIKVVAK